MTPYPRYKPTSIPWLPQVPEHWKVKKAKRVFKERSEKGFPDEPLLAATQSQGVVRKDAYENRTVTAQKDFHLLKLVHKNDFVISLRSFQGGIEIAHDQGIISPAYSIFTAKDTNIENAFYKHLFKSTPFISSLSLFVTGIREGQNIDFTEFQDSLLPIPPHEEQTAIARYLDGKCALIDTFIAKKQNLIELLREQKQAIINKAVTRGINPNVRLKPSGIEWLGEIPEHWEVRKLKYVAKVQPSSVDKNSEPGEMPVQLCNYVDVYKNEFIERSLQFMKATATPSEIAKFKLDAGDVLITKDSETPGDIANPALVTEVGDKVICGYHLAQIKPLLVTGKYLFRLFQSSAINAHFETSANGVTRYGLGVASIKDCLIPIPRMQEQDEIFEHIRDQSTSIGTIITRIEKEIELLQEYKQSLIAEVVTGKICLNHDSND